MHLVGGITAAASSLIVDTVTGLPTAPFTLLLDPGTGTEEVVLVTAAGGTTLTVTRGVGGTSAQSHLNGAEVLHAYYGQDFQDSRDHEANTTTAHGVTGVVVGTTSVQALTNKTVDGALNTLTNVPKVALPTDVAYLATAQTLTNKTIDGATNTFTNVPTTALTDGPIVATTGVFSGAVSGTTGTFTGNVTSPSIKAVPLVYTDDGLATSGSVNVFTTPVRTVTDPFGAGVPYRCKVTYLLGYTGGSGNGRVNINVNGVGAFFMLVNAGPGAAPSVIRDMPAGGSINFQGALTNVSAVLATYLDGTSHVMTTEVSPL
jgi:hypothetical protein